MAFRFPRPHLLLTIAFLFIFSEGIAQVGPVVNPVASIALKNKRYAHSSVLVPPCLYLFGGRGGGVEHTDVEKMDLSKQPWKSEIFLPADSLLERIYGAAASDGKKIYLFGGYQERILNLGPDGEKKLNNLRVYLDLTESIDLQAKKVTTLQARMPRPRWVSEAHFLDEKIYLIGGAQVGVCECCKKRRCSAVEIFSPKSGKFRAGSRMLTPREANTARFPDGKIIAFGGFDGSKSRNEVEVFSPQQWQWKSLSKMPFPMSTGGTCFWNGHIISIGDFSNSSLIGVYDIEKDRWHYGRGARPIPHQTTAHQYKGNIFVIGGKFRDMSAMDTIQVYDAKKLVEEIKGK